MKKYLSFLLAGSLVVALGACSAQEETKQEEKVEETAGQTEDNAKAVRSSLLSYQGEVTKVIRSVEGTLADPEQDPTAAVATFGDDVKAIAIPEELKDYTTDIEAALENLTQYYTKKAELLKAQATDMSEAETFKEEYITNMTKVFDGVELSPPVFSSLFG
ncbi:hypothetical protein ACFYKX_02310 [Cytobacillus sp. FJAT-54145]|uniref:Lipoprotein n=1 Tax=Cytobacillus spartinae TaxID=3299023 RepID=A0ABW6K5K9_9BACI